MTTRCTARSITQDWFAAADQKFSAFKDRLAGSETLPLEHSAVERLIDVEGREVLRERYQEPVAYWSFEWFRVRSER